MMTDDTRTLEIDGLPTRVGGHDHDHATGRHRHHDGRADAENAPVGATFRPPFSLVRLSVGGRLAIAALLSIGVWSAVYWARMPIG